MMRKKILAALALAVCIGMTATERIYAQDWSENAATGVSEKKEALQAAIETLASDPCLSQAVVGICVRTGAGETLVDINSGTMMVPASNMKLLTTGAAMYALGPGYRFETGLAYDGTIRDGVLNGDLYIVGGADPTLGSKDTTAVAIEKTFAQWESLLRKAGIHKIAGHIIGDGRAMNPMAEEPTWLWNDIGTYYGTGTTGLMFYENMQSFIVTPGPAEGSPVNINPYYPSAPWMEFRYSCTTGKNGTGDRLYMYTSDLAPVAEIRGTFAADRARKRVDCSNKFPEYTCARYFADWLSKRGIHCSGGAADFKLRTEWITAGHGAAESGSLVQLGCTQSPTLDRIVYVTNHASNNLYAETLIRMLGKRLKGSTDYEAACPAMEETLRSIGTDTSTGIHIQDGSGLSQQNLVSPDFFCRFLEDMMGVYCFEQYVESLPSPGFKGTLQYNMKSYPETMRARIKVKSGSMNGVRCYSGYIIPTEGAKNETLIFSIMVNNCTAPNWKVRPLLDKIMAQLAESN